MVFGMALISCMSEADKSKKIVVLILRLISLVSNSIVSEYDISHSTVFALKNIIDCLLKFS